MPVRPPPTFVHRTMVRRLPGIVLGWLLVGALVAQPDLPTTGTALLDVRNRRDINHPRNMEAREKLMRAAVLDAVERVVAIDISVTTELRVSEQRTDKASAYHESYMNEVLQRYHVAWTRTGDYVFRRDPSRPKAWICTVSGMARQLSATKSPALRKEKEEGGLPPYILAKRGASVYLSPEGGGGMAVGQRFEVVKRTGVGERVTGRIVVRSSDPGAYPYAHIINGRYAVRERQILRPAKFPLMRGGLAVGYFEREAWRRAEGAHDGRLISGVSFDFFEQGLLQGFGVTFGIDLLSDNMGDTLKLQSMTGRFGVMARMPLVPEVLYLRVVASLGIAAFHERYGNDGQFLLQGQADLCVNMGPVDLVAGARYLHLPKDPGLGGTYVIAGLGLDLYRFMPEMYERDTPGLRSLMSSSGSAR